MSSDKIGLVEAIHALREELREAQEKAPVDLKFRVEDIEVSFEVVTEKTIEAGGGLSGKIKFWVFDASVEADSKGSYGTTRSHSVKLKLIPEDHRNGEVRNVEVNDIVPTPGSTEDS